MKKCLVNTVVLWFAFLPGFSLATVQAQKTDSHQPSRWGQFGRSGGAATHGAHTKPQGHPHDPAAAALARGQSTVMRAPAGPKQPPHAVVAPQPKTSASSSTPVSFVAGGRTPLGGTDDDETNAVMGDFNGDGKPDVAKVVETVTASNRNAHSETTTYQVAVLLGNGDGTFKTAVLTDTDGNTDDPIVVGDLKGDGTDDIIQVHPEGDNCESRQQAAAARRHTLPSCGSSIDVMISNGSGGFAAPVNYPVTGASLVGGILTDVNGDGKLDVLVFDDSSPANVIEMLGNGDGTFEAATTLGQLTTTAPEGMFFADFNGDGNIDFAGYNDSGQIAVTLASGAGAYANAPVTLNNNSGVYGGCGTATGDLNGDSKPEIVTFNCGMNTVTVYVNKGDGTFAAGEDYDNNGNQYQRIIQGVVTDINGDGNGDIVAINAGTADVSVFLGHGDGTVAVDPLRYGVGGFAWEVPLVADFNGDGLMDVVESDDEYNLVYLQGYGEGTFKAAPVYSLPNTFGDGSYTNSVATGDFNGDGIPDVAVTSWYNYGESGVTVFLGKGDGTFGTGVSYGPSSFMYGVVVGDFNNDGNLDIAAIDDDSYEIQILLGNGDGTFRVGGLFPADTSEESDPYGLAVGDFNKDGNLDLAVANYETGDVAVLLGNGDGTFAYPVAYPAPNELGPVAIVAVDVNGDGFLDLLAPSVADQSAVVVYLGNTDHSGTFQAGTAVNINGEPDFAAFGDLNGDGKIDMAVTEYDGATYYGQIEILLGKGDGTFNSPVAYQASAFGGATYDSEPGNIAMMDMNGDGNLDLVYLMYYTGTLAVATGKGDGTVNSPVEFPTSDYPWGMALADLTGDGVSDVLVGDDWGGGFSVLINGSGSAANPNYSMGTQTPSASVTAGSSATYTVNLAGTNGYTGTITFTCGNLPTGATCSFSPSSVVAKGAVPQTTTLTISTTASTTASLFKPLVPVSKPGSTVLLAGLSGMGLFGMLLIGSDSKRRTRMVTALMVLLILGTLIACSGTSTGSKVTTSSGTPAGTYVVTVTSTGTGTGSPTHTMNLTLTVQ